MKARLLKDMRIQHKAGEIVEVSPVEGEFLLSVRSAIRVTETETEEQKTKPATTRKGKK